MRMKRRVFLVCSAVGTTGCLEVLEGNGEEIREPQDIVIVEATLVRDNPGTEEERVHIWGVARNESDRRWSYVEIRATFYDEEGEELDSVIENVPDVTSGEEWPFEIEYPHFGEDAAAVADYELEPSTGV